MAAPEFAAEQVLTLQRMEWAIRSALTEKDRLAALDEAARQGEAARVIRSSRAASDEESDLPQTRAAAREMVLLRRQVALAQLAESDINALLQFYESEAGRAKREALVSAFAAENDQDGREALAGFFAALGEKQP